ncbi:MAG: YceI family protein [Solirubrobacteraceae bacterium]
MSSPVGTYTLNSENGTLSVHTRRAGAAAKAGHDLLIEVGSWEGILELAEDRAASSVTLTADAGSLRVLDGTGGMTKLGDDDKVGIKQTIDDDVLKGARVAFTSSGVRPSADGRRLEVDGELELRGRREPLSFALDLDESGRLSGSATLKQTAWGIKPYSALFGALKVADEVTVSVQAQLPG